MYGINRRIFLGNFIQSNIWGLTVFLVFLCSCSNKKSNRAAIQYNNRGCELYDSLFYEKAIKECKKGLVLENVHEGIRSEILQNIAIAFDQMGSYDSAEVYFNKAIKLCKKDFYDYFIIEAYLFLYEGQIEQAIERLNKAKKQNYNAFRANNLLGLIYLGVYDTTYFNPQKALTYNDIAYAFEPSRIGAEILIHNNFYLKDYTTIEEILKKLLEIHPDCIEYHSLLIISNRLHGKVDMATKLYQELIEDFPSDKVYIDYYLQEFDTSGSGIYPAYPVI